MRRKVTLALVGFVTLSLHCFCAAVAQVSSGQFTYPFTDFPLWDISGSYTNGMDTDDIVIVVTHQQSNGRITGVRSEVFDNGVDHIEGTGYTSGRIFSKPPTVGFKGGWKGTLSGVSGGVSFIGTAKGRGTGVIVPSTLSVLETISTRVCIVGHKCLTQYGEVELPLPDGMTGDWSLDIDFTASGNVLTGTGTITLSNSRELGYQVTGSYNATTQTSKLRLVGTGEALGTRLSVTTQGTDMALTQLKGKVLGQKLSFP